MTPASSRQPDTGGGAWSLPSGRDGPVPPGPDGAVPLGRDRPVPLSASGSVPRDDPAEPPRRSARVRAAISGMVVLVLVGFSAAVIAAIVTPGGERVELAAGVGGEGGSGGEVGSSGEGTGDPAQSGSDVVDGGLASGGVGGSEAGVGGAEPGVDTVVVHVSGAVAQPGVVELLIGSRVVDALAQAGGPDDEADLSALNLARPLVDGEQVHVPVKGEAPPGGAASAGAAGGSSGAGASGAGAPVNINTAGSAELESLPGVGPALAGRIIAWREQNGQFRSVDELLAVSGIGEKTLAGFRDQVTV